jgi:hypothetical protein
MSDDIFHLENYQIISLMINICWKFYIISHTKLSYRIVNDISLTKIIISYRLTKSDIGLQLGLIFGVGGKSYFSLGWSGRNDLLVG